MAEHNILWVKLSHIFPYRDDERFNRFMHWTDYLRGRVVSLEIALKKREKLYLQKALTHYPPTASDSAMSFHVSKTLSADDHLNHIP